MIRVVIDTNVVVSANTRLSFSLRMVNFAGLRLVSPRRWRVTAPACGHLMMAGDDDAENVPSRKARPKISSANFAGIGKVCRKRKSGLLG
jgi:hypothetical protein